MVRLAMDVNGVVVGFSIWRIFSVGEIECEVEEVDDFQVRIDCDPQAEVFELFR